MSIKKSFLEKKILYRIAKSLFIVLPFIATIAFYFYRHLNITDIVKNNSIYLAYVFIGYILYFIILQVIWRGFLYIAFGGLEDDTIAKINKGAQTGIPATKIPQAKPNQTGGQLVPVIIVIIILVIVGLSLNGDIKLPQFDFLDSHKYGTSCSSSTGEKGLYSTDGNCLTCSSGVASKNPINDNCSKPLEGIYCCITNGNNTDGNNGNNNGQNGCIPTGCGTLWRCSGTIWVGNVSTSIDGCFPTGARPGDINVSWSGKCRQCP